MAIATHGPREMASPRGDKAEANVGMIREAVSDRFATKDDFRHLKFRLVSELFVATCIIVVALIFLLGN